MTKPPLILHITPTIYIREDKRVFNWAEAEASPEPTGDPDFTTKYIRLDQYEALKAMYNELYEEVEARRHMSALALTGLGQLLTTYDEPSTRKWTKRAVEARLFARRVLRKALQEKIKRTKKKSLDY